MSILGQIVLVELPCGEILIDIGVIGFVRLIFKCFDHAEDIDVSEELIGVVLQSSSIVNNFGGGLQLYANGHIRVSLVFQLMLNLHRLFSCGYRLLRQVPFGLAPHYQDLVRNVN